MCSWEGRQKASPCPIILVASKFSVMSSACSPVHREKESYDLWEADMEYSEAWDGAPLFFIKLVSKEIKMNPDDCHQEDMPPPHAQGVFICRGFLKHLRMSTEAKSQHAKRAGVPDQDMQKARHERHRCCVPPWDSFPGGVKSPGRFLHGGTC